MCSRLTALVLARLAHHVGPELSAQPGVLDAQSRGRLPVLPRPAGGAGGPVRRRSEAGVGVCGRSQLRDGHQAERRGSA